MESFLLLLMVSLAVSSPVPQTPETVKEVIAVLIAESAKELDFDLKVKMVYELNANFWQIATGIGKKKGNLTTPDHTYCTNLTKKLETHLVRIMSRDYNYDEFTGEVVAHQFLEYAWQRIIRSLANDWTDVAISVVTTREIYIRLILHILSKSFP